MNPCSNCKNATGYDEWPGPLCPGCSHPTPWGCNKGEYCCPHCERLHLLAIIEGLVAGMKEIKENCGAVCIDFELCTHETCRSSHYAWATAYMCLKKVLAPTNEV